MVKIQIIFRYCKVAFFCDWSIRVLEEIRNLIVEVLGRDELDIGEVPVARDLGIIMVK